jgi:hypothetical protein
MIRDSRIRTKVNDAHIVGAKPAGITKKVASGVEEQVKSAFGKSGKQVTVKGMRFIPSTKVDLGQGAFQVMANTVVEVAGTGSHRREESVDSVVTVDRGERRSQTLRAVKIPSLDRAYATA